MKVHIIFAVGSVLTVVGLSIAQASELYSVHYTSATPLYVMDQTTGAATPIGPTGFDNVGDLTSDTRLGSYRLWGVKIDTNQLLEINPASGSAVVAANLNSPDDIVSIAFDVVSGKLFGNTSVGFGAPFESLYEIDPASGNCTFIGRILFDNVYSLGFDQGGNLFGVSDLNNELISISTSTGNGTLIAALQVDSAFDIASRPEDDTTFLVDTGTTHLWKLNTGNGALTDVGPYGGSSPNLVGLAFSPVPEPGIFVMMAAGLVAGLAHIVFRRKHSDFTNQ